MDCIYCGSLTRVKNSRLQRTGNHIWRRRQCQECGSMFTTRENAALDESLMVDRGGSRLEPFSRDKLFLTIYESCRHRPSALKDATALTQTIIDRLAKSQRLGVLSTEAIIHQVHVTLSRFDQTAATFYAAYHAVVRPSVTS